MNRKGVVDIAKICAVSPSTVCRALNDRSDINEKTRARILAACRKYGYSRNQAASGLRQKTSTVIAGLMPEATHELFIEKVAALKNNVLNAGYVWRFYSYQNAEECVLFFNEIVSSRPAGIVLTCPVDSDMKRLIKQNGIPVVCYDQNTPGLDSVAQNRARGYFDACTYLIKRGRKKIALIGVDKKTSESLRLTGYQNALKNAGIAMDNSLIITDAFGTNVFDYGYHIAKKIYGSLDFDACLTVNDACAIGMMRFFSEIGALVPSDIAVIGFDDLMVSSFVRPALTTLAQPKTDMADASIDQLLHRIRNFSAKRQFLEFVPVLKERESA